MTVNRNVSLKEAAKRLCQSTVSRQLFLFTATRSVLASVMFVGFSISSAYGTSYDFIQGGTGDTLATLTTDGTDPFDHTNVVEISFTSAGDALFGFGTGVIPFVFQATTPSSAEWTEVGGGLQTVDVSKSGSLRDLDTTVPSSFNPTHPLGGVTFVLFADDAAGGDGMFYGDVPDGGVVDVFVDGDWASAAGGVVPEPSTAILLIIGLAGLAACGHRGRRRRS